MDIIIPKEDESYDEYINRILNSRPNKKIKDVYQERHHIIPKCMGGTDDKINRVYLYAQEHYYAHKLLALENPDIEGLQYAWWNMCQCQRGGRTYDVTADEFAEARARESKCTVDRLKAHYLTHNSPNLGVKFSEEHRKKISKALTGIVRSSKTKELTALHHADVSGDKNPRAKTVKCLETGDIFTTISSAMEWANIGNRNAIPDNANNKRSYAGKHPITGEKLHWVFIEQ